MSDYDAAPLAAASVHELIEAALRDQQALRLEIARVQVALAEAEMLLRQSEALVAELTEERAGLRH